MFVMLDMVLDLKLQNIIFGCISASDNVYFLISGLFSLFF